MEFSTIFILAAGFGATGQPRNDYRAAFSRLRDVVFNDESVVVILERYREALTAANADAGVGVFLAAWTAVLGQRRLKWYTSLPCPALFLVLLGVAWKSVTDDTLGR